MDTMNTTSPVAVENPGVSPARGRGPVGRAFTGYLLAILLGIAGTLVLVFCLGLADMVDPGGGDGPASPDWMAASILLSTLPFELALLLVAALRAREPGIGARQRLGLVSPRLSAGRWLIVLGALGVPLILAGLAAASMPTFRDPGLLLSIWKGLTPLAAVGWVVLIGVVPGVCEEVFFRGFMQRQLMKAWSPWTAIVVTSVLFGLLHIDPQAIAMATVLGVWLGWVAWRTGSIVPCIAMHTLVNSGWNALQIVVQQSEVPERQQWIALGVYGVVSLVCFVVAVAMLRGQGARAETQGQLGLAS